MVYVQCMKQKLWGRRMCVRAVVRVRECVCVCPHNDCRVLACLYPCQQACVSEHHWIISTGGQWVSG